MILLLLEISFLFAFVAVLFFLMRKKKFSNYRAIFDHYTALGVLITFTLCMINSIVLLDFSEKLPLLAGIAIILDVLSPFWVPIFFYLMNKRIENLTLRRFFRTLSILGISIVIGVYTVLLSGIIS
ncbi:MAG: hypothetical protein HYZ10_10510 [Ignavibacteriales bacterium]|nr:hypothetical protein [Ignavibacteriales bacterium]OGU64319.1 MAG: hypothetical protein A2X62_00710 [Stygiobacter sp. GWC2_38_9]OGU84916.1 MAG: hypothetical protein A2279_08460 [Stygiobacter sp. RIFOXYA12_FULL_38_9]OGV06876.1 MAG: hypothetical protein A2299_03125 [Stygiobacter sp. RIFOXYB2_FULL_37_11]OGV11592.1 MAG: hypothetical protein A2237_04960 [Stygiobacter sp. RIFOXYA2_FULL_38_8]OGV13335.1 MAG: hypothetical protein A2440_13505 [Stygiobacter sp. RIFOXYC2_FULL_38_25]OGV30287.1 MAG: hypo